MARPTNNKAGAAKRAPSNNAPGTNRLVAMVITLSQSKGEKDRFRADPEAYMRAARLGSRQKTAIRRAIAGDVTDLDEQFRAGYQRGGAADSVADVIAWSPEAIFW